MSIHPTLPSDHAFDTTSDFLKSVDKTKKIVTPFKGGTSSPANPTVFFRRFPQDYLYNTSSEDPT